MRETEVMRSRPLVLFPGHAPPWCSARGWRGAREWSVWDMSLARSVALCGAFGCSAGV